MRNSCVIKRMPISGLPWRHGNFGTKTQQAKYGTCCWPGTFTWTPDEGWWTSRQVPSLAAHKRIHRGGVDARPWRWSGGPSIYPFNALLFSGTTKKTASRLTWPAVSRTLASYPAGALFHQKNFRQKLWRNWRPGNETLSVRRWSHVPVVSSSCPRQLQTPDPGANLIKVNAIKIQKYIRLICIILVVDAADLIRLRPLFRRNNWFFFPQKAMSDWWQRGKGHGKYCRSRSIADVDTKIERKVAGDW